MSYEEITAMLAETGLPFAYHHFAEGESPEPPFLVYLIPGSNNFSADGIVWLKVKQLDIELYTDRKDPVMEEKLETVLDVHGLFYNRTETWIDSEKMYEVLYELEV